VVQTGNILYSINKYVFVSHFLTARLIGNTRYKIYFIFLLVCMVMMAEKLCTNITVEFLDAIEILKHSLFIL
jgi:hypothetical protein